MASLTVPYNYMPVLKRRNLVKMSALGKKGQDHAASHSASMAEQGQGRSPGLSNPGNGITYDLA